MVDIAKLLELESKATKANWEYDDGTRWGGYQEPPMPQVKPSIKIGDSLMEFDGFGYDFDAELIVEMRNNIRQICLELKAARECVELLENTKEFFWDSDRDKAKEVLDKYREVTGNDK